MTSINITEIRNAVSLNDENTEFEVEINHPEHGWILYAIDPNDPDTTIDNSELLKLIGTNYTAMAQSEKDAREARVVRLSRDGYLRDEVDAVMSNPERWAGLSTSKQDEWKQYRTDLLNVPQQSGFPHNVTYPTKPS